MSHFGTFNSRKSLVRLDLFQCLFVAQVVFELMCSHVCFFLMVTVFYFSHSFSSLSGLIQPACSGLLVLSSYFKKIPKKSIYFSSVCLCVRACVYACTCVCVCVRDDGCDLRMLLCCCCCCYYYFILFFIIVVLLLLLIIVIINIIISITLSVSEVYRLPPRWPCG